MGLIIIELGSGNTCKNDLEIVKDMIDAVVKKDTGKHDIVFKMQLFKNQPPNIPLHRDIFEYAYDYADKKKYEMTASVFDLSSLRFLEEFAVPFVKIANNPKLFWLAHFASMPALISVNNDNDFKTIWLGGFYPLCCRSEYPMAISGYKKFNEDYLSLGISDHTIGLDLYKQFLPAIWEKHFILEYNKDNPDAGAFAMIPDDLKEIL